MSFQLECPNCGCRPVWEFHYGGPTRSRPAADAQVTEREWAEYLYNRPNVAGEQTEWWYHRSACKLWFQAKRNTVNNVVLGTMRAGAAPAEGGASGG